MRGEQATMYCRRCGYVLDGLRGLECPECGRPFHPARRRSFHRKPLRPWWWRWPVRAAKLLLILVVLLVVWVVWNASRHFLFTKPAMTALAARGASAAPQFGDTDWIRRIAGPKIGTWFADVAVNAASLGQFSDDDMHTAARISRLAGLEVRGTAVGDAGLEHLRGRGSLWYLGLAATDVTDAGAAMLPKIGRLRSVDVSRTAITDAGLEHLGDLEHLERLDLSFTAVTGSGFHHLRGCEKLTDLALFDAPIVDVYLEDLAALPALTSLDLSGTEVTDAGIAHLLRMRSLQYLALFNTRVSDEGIRRLREARPGLAIDVN